jgi:hypothetical protein
VTGCADGWALCLAAATPPPRPLRPEPPPRRLPQALARAKKLSNSAPLQYQRVCSTLGFDLEGAAPALAAAQGPPASVEALARRLALAVAGGQPGAVASLLECLSSQVSQEIMRPGGLGLQDGLWWADWGVALPRLLLPCAHAGAKRGRWQC